VTPSDVQDDGALVQLTNVYKRFGRRIALRGVSFGLSTGEAVAVLGANGAGKTTMLRTAATLARPTRGSVTAFGVDAWAERVQVRARLGVVAHQPYVYPELTCAENLEFFAAMFKVGHREQVVAGALERVGLAARSGQRAGELSRGLLQRLNIARATLHDPPVLILDEPDTGLDAAGRSVLAEIIGDAVRAWRLRDVHDPLARSGYGPRNARGCDPRRPGRSRCGTERPERRGGCGHDDRSPRPGRSLTCAGLARWCGKT
jgi:heme exporter protein A